MSLQETQTFYQILQIPEDAEPQAIKRSYFRLIRKHTPDQDPQGFERIRRAYEVLSEPKRRQEYDALQKHGETFQELMQIAEAQMEKEEWEKAVRSLKEALVLVPTVNYARCMLAACYLALKKFEEARGVLKTLVGTEATEELPFFLLGRSYHEEAGEQDGKTEAGREKAKLLYSRGLEAFQEAHKRDPLHPSRMKAIASSYFNLFNLPKAIEWLSKALPQDDKISSLQDLDLYVELLFYHILHEDHPAFESVLDRLFAIAERYKSRILEGGEEDEEENEDEGEDNEEEEDKKEDDGLLLHRYVSKEMLEMANVLEKQQDFATAALLYRQVERFLPGLGAEKDAERYEHFNRLKQEFFRIEKESHLAKNFQGFLILALLHLLTEEEQDMKTLLNDFFASLDRMEARDVLAQLRALHQHYPACAKQYEGLFHRIQELCIQGTPHLAGLRSYPKELPKPQAESKAEPKGSTEASKTTTTAVVTTEAFKSAPSSSYEKPVHVPESLPPAKQSDPGCFKFLGLVVLGMSIGAVFGPVGIVLGAIVGVVVAFQE